MAESWDAVSLGVLRTIHSLQAQTDPHWRLILASQAKPIGWPEDDPRLVFLPYEEDTGRMDKSGKIRHLMQALPDNMSGQDGYMHALDGDDVMHPDLVAHIRRDNNGRGYWHPRGGMIDAATNALARCGPRTLKYPTAKPFLSHCGSGAAIYVDFRTDDRYAPFAARFYHSGHRNFFAAARAHGVTLDPVPFPSALYVMNTGENMRQKRGKLSTKMRYLRQNLLPKDEAARWRDEFGWDAATAAATGSMRAASPPG